MLRSPRSTIWPLPLYVAGVETTDGVYQDWILDYLGELGSWGAHIQAGTETLRNIISMQESTGSRVKFGKYDYVNEQTAAENIYV